MKPSIFFLSLLLLFSATSSFAAEKDISLKFSTIETEHFSIHFHQGLDDLAQNTAAIAEGVHPKLVKQFIWEPQEKTQIVLIDDNDFTNGYASVLPYNTIYMQTVPPFLVSTIGEYDDWLRMLIVHEYTHILTMDPARGYSSVMRKIFGKPIPGDDIFSLLMFIATAPPNSLMPSWWQEGMSVWAETEYTEAGRGRSTFYDMILRMSVAENNFPSVDQINGDLPYWPDGHMPYIFGLRLQKYIADRYGKDALGKLNLAHAGRFPYFISGPVDDLFDRHYSDLYREMITDLKKEEGQRIETLKKAHLTPIKTLDLDGESLTNPRSSPDGRYIAYNRKDPHRHEAIMVADRSGNAPREIVRRRYSDRAVCWSPDGNILYFSQAEIVRGFNIFQDLYSYDLNRQQLQRLTNGLRIKEPDVSPDGKRFAVIIHDKGKQGLAVLNFESGKPRLKDLTGLMSVRLSGPRWSPDGNMVAYEAKDTNGKSGIHIYDTLRNSDSVLFESSHNYGFPAWSPDGSYIIYSSDETGVFNLFAYFLNDHKQFQITSVIGGVFQADISPDGREIVFSSYESRGFKIASLENSRDGWTTANGPVITPCWKEEKNPAYSDKTVQSDPATGRKEKSNEIPSRPYSALNTLIPRFWLPTLSGDHKGLVAGAFTAGQDVLGYNTIVAEVDYGTSSGRGYYDLIYLNDYAYPTFMLQAFQAPVLYSDLLGEGDYYEQNNSVILGMSVPLNYLESRYRFTLGYHIQRQEELGLPDNVKRGQYNLFEGHRSNAFAKIDFFNGLKYPYSISHEEGRKISLEYRHYSRETGSGMDSREYIASYDEYIPILFDITRHHVLYYRLTGAASEGDRTLQQAFQIGGVFPQKDYFPQKDAFPLRGYPSRFATGQYLATGTLEYRAPIKYIFRGPGTTPFFFDRVHAAAFVDIGEIWDDNTGFTSDRVKVGAGLEARLDMTLGYRLGITPAVGVAHGFNEGGETTVYLTIYSNL